MKERPVTDERAEVRILFTNLKRDHSALEALLSRCSEEWGAPDAVYRFYHQSFELYPVQSLTVDIVEALQALAPQRELNSWFRLIITEGTGKKFVPDVNQRWLQETRPMVEAFFHAKHFLEMAVRSARELDEPPTLLPIPWATILYLYKLR